MDTHDRAREVLAAELEAVRLKWHAIAGSGGTVAGGVPITANEAYVASGAMDWVVARFNRFAAETNAPATTPATDKVQAGETIAVPAGMVAEEARIEAIALDAADVIRQHLMSCWCLDSLDQRQREELEGEITSVTVAALTDRLAYTPKPTAVQAGEGAEMVLVPRAVLESLERWEMPATGRFWNNADGTQSDRPMSYGAAFGSRGERDYVQGVIRGLLNTPQPAASDQRAEVDEAGKFLLQRLVDHEIRMTSDRDAREWFGHVTPAMARFRAALASTSHDAAMGDG